MSADWKTVGKMPPSRRKPKELPIQAEETLREIDRELVAVAAKHHPMGLRSSALIDERFLTGAPLDDGEIMKGIRGGEFVFDDEDRDGEEP